MMKKTKKKYQEQNFVISDKNSDNEDKALTDGGKTNSVSVIKHLYLLIMQKNDNIKSPNTQQRNSWKQQKKSNKMF